MTLAERNKRAVEEHKTAPDGILSVMFKAYERAKSIVEQENENHGNADCIVVDFVEHKVYWVSSINAVNMYDGDYSIVYDIIEDTPEEEAEELRKKYISEFEPKEHEKYYLSYAEIDKVIFLLGPDMEVAMHYVHNYKNIDDAMYSDYLHLLESCYRPRYKGMDKEKQMLYFSHKFFESEK